MLSLYASCQALLPYQVFPLHVPRNLPAQFRGITLSPGETFGVVLVEAEEENNDRRSPQGVGTCAEIMAVSQGEDGSRDLIALGGDRFQIQSLSDDPHGLVGFVSPISDCEWEDTPANGIVLARAERSLDDHIAAALGGPNISLRADLLASPSALSFVIASLLPLPQPERQRLLEMTDTAERLAEIVPLLELETAKWTETDDPLGFTDGPKYFSEN